MSKLKNLIIFYPSIEIGGATAIFYNLVEIFSKKKVNLIIITSKSNNNYSFKKKIKIISSNNFFIPFINNRIISSFICSISLFKTLLRLKSHNTKVLSMQSNFFSVIISFLLNFKIAVRVSEDPCGASIHSSNLLFGWIIFFTKIITYNLSTLIITNATRSKFCIKNIILSSKKIKVLFNPYLKKIYNFKLIKTPKKIIFSAGRFTKQKNFSCLIEAYKIISQIKKYKDYKLIICGSGTEELILKKKIIDYNLRNKIFIYSWNNNLKNFYLKSQLYVLPSLYEGMPNTLIDAINYEIPIISSDVSGVADLIVNPKSYQIINKINKYNLASSIIKALEDYSSLKRNSKILKKNLFRYTVNRAGLNFWNTMSKF